MSEQSTKPFEIKKLESRPILVDVPSLDEVGALKDRIQTMSRDELTKLHTLLAEKRRKSDNGEKDADGKKTQWTMEHVAIIRAVESKMNSNQEQIKTLKQELVQLRKKQADLHGKNWTGEDAQRYLAIREELKSLGEPDVRLIA